MSHTDKDRPYWVQTNDPTLPRHENHNHYSLGRTYIRRRHARDADGKYLYELHVDHVPVLKYNMDWYLSWEGRKTSGDLDPISHPRDRMRFYRYELQERWEPVYENYTVAYVDHCTIDEPAEPTSSRRDQPCGMALDYWYFNPFGGGPDKFQRQTFNTQQRRRERDALKSYVKEVNSADDWADLDDSSLPHDRHRHTIIWW